MDSPPYQRCECCHFADVRANAKEPVGYGVGCLHPKCSRGQAGVGKSCCYFEREPGTDDALERLPSLGYWLTGRP